jgi:two-component system, sensor histidine kinase
MSFAARNSVQRKVMVMVLATTFSALFVAAAALLLYEVRTYRDAWLNDLATQADILGRSSAPALTFDDRKAALANLELLKSRPNILAAALYLPDGRIFASYAQDPRAAFPAAPGPPGHSIRGASGSVFYNVVEDGERIGTLYLHARYELWSRLLDYLAILAVVMLISLLVAFVVSVWLQARLTRPILQVAAVARKVVEERDFSLRAARTTDDEIGLLVDAFNAMLTEVARRAEALEASNATLKRETAERTAAEMALRLADRRKDEFLATLAHELRNPLAPMSNALTILRTVSADAGVSQQARDMIDRQLKQMVRLVDDLLDVSRITTGKLVLHQTALDLNDVLRAAVETARPMIDARGHRLVVQVPDQPLPVRGDAVRLAQVFANLLNNAAKYTDSGGKIELSAWRSGDRLAVRISDNGIGIPPQILPAIFEMFTQGDTSLERTHAGLGVGLSLARRLVEMHAGSIEAHSEGIGKGSVFTVHLPAADGAAGSAPSQEAALPAMPSRGARVLLVDDNVDFATSMAALLENAGHEVRLAHDAAGALTLAEAFEPDFGFFDIGLPGMSGFELARRFRSLPFASGSVLVAVTGWGQEKDRELAREAGFDHHLVKPVDFAAIESLLARDGR